MNVWTCPYCQATSKPERWSKGYVRCGSCLRTFSSRRLYVDDAAADAADLTREELVERARARHLRRMGGKLRQLYELDNGRCHLCGGKVRWGAEGDGAPTRDHVIPRLFGGTNHFSNLKLAHAGCNRKRGVMTVQEWHARRADLTS